MVRLIETARVVSLVFPLTPIFRSGIHEIDQIDNVVVEFGAGGVVGTGFTFAFRRADAEATCALAADLAATLVGEPIASVRDHWSQLWSRLNFIGHQGPSIMALSAIDTALWDLHARTLKVPLHELFGTGEDAWPVYASGGSLELSVDELVAEGREIQSRGYAGYKLRVGGPDLATDIERVEAVRDALGFGYPLMVDANQGWSRVTALAACRALSNLNLTWIEEPLDCEDIEGLALLRRRSEVPVAAGETAYGVRGLSELIRADAVDFLQPDLMRCGGVTPFVSIANLASAANVAVMPHLYTDFSAHLMGLLPPGAMIEYLPGWFDHLFGPPQIANGRLTPGGPGLGLRLSEERTSSLIASEWRSDRHQGGDLVAGPA